MGQTDYGARHELHHYINDKTKKLGGIMVPPPVNIPGATSAWIADPDGNTVGLWKPAPPAQIS